MLAATPVGMTALSASLLTDVVDVAAGELDRDESLG